MKRIQLLNLIGQSIKSLLDPDFEYASVPTLSVTELSLLSVGVIAACTVEMKTGAYWAWALTAVFAYIAAGPGTWLMSRIEYAVLRNFQMAVPPSICCLVLLSLRGYVDPSPAIMAFTTTTAYVALAAFALETAWTITSGRNFIVWMYPPERSLAHIRD